jgi:glycosyltransferase involved in cell wall biosynthesis
MPATSLPEPERLFGCKIQPMTTNTPKISVVVASHNARATIEECLSAVVAQRQDSELEIVVVDNSTDGTSELIRSGFPDNHNPR